jgi:hypothetical protein
MMQGAAKALQAGMTAKGKKKKAKRAEDGGEKSG